MPAKVISLATGKEVETPKRRVVKVTKTKAAPLSPKLELREAEREMKEVVKHLEKTDSIERMCSNAGAFLATEHLAAARDSAREALVQIQERRKSL